MKIYNKNKNVLVAANERLDIIFHECQKICISFSGGKDSSVMLQLALAKAAEHNKKVDVLFIDMEAQYLKTIEHINQLSKNAYIDCFYWIALPLSLRNAVSVFEPRWISWEESKRDKWIRSLPEKAITLKNNIFDFYKYGMEFEEFIPEFEKWYESGVDGICAHLVGIRSDESLNRWRTIASDTKIKYKNFQWSTFNRKTKKSYSFFPLYDWQTADIWTAVAKLDLEYNEVYELMYKNGLSIHDQRLCQPFGDDQRNGLDQYKVIEHDNWEKILNRVSGVNFGNIYCRTSALGNIKSEKPKHMTWEQWSVFLLESLGIYNPELELHYYKKICKFLDYYEKAEGITVADIKDEGDKKLEASRKIPTWRRIARAIERNDFFMSRLSFSQNKSDVERLKALVVKYKNLLSTEATDSRPLKRSYNKIQEEIENEN